MCEFKSALVTRAGEVVESWETDRHNELMEMAGFRESVGNFSVRVRDFVAVELRAGSLLRKAAHPDCILDLGSYQLWLDDPSFKPHWYNDVFPQARASLLSRVKDSIVLTSRKTLSDGCWIIGPKAHIGDVKSGRIVANFGVIESVWDGVKVERNYGSIMEGPELSEAQHRMQASIRANRTFVTNQLKGRKVTTVYFDDMISLKGS